mmetsp:Transcript_34884/g.90382  ORF Transcript_34884/g.90382 Transcript_34884/m.90382 type:complete len:306 (-) Transcript_34884:298-1215(-)
MNEKKVRLQLLDTSGEERFQVITNAHFRDTMGVMIAYDITSRTSFENVSSWLQQIDKFSKGRPVNKLLVGCKAELDELRKVSREEGKKLADQLQINIFETSAKTRRKVEEAFFDIVRDCVFPRRERSKTRQDLSLRDLRTIDTSTLSISPSAFNNHVYDGDCILGYAPDFEVYAAMTGEGTKYHKNRQHYNYWNACRPDIMRPRTWPRGKYRIVPIHRIAKESKNACMLRREATDVWASKSSSYSNNQKKAWDYNFFWLLEQELGSKHKWKDAFDMEKGDYGIVKGGVACDDQKCFWVYGVVPKC